MAIALLLLLAAGPDRWTYWVQPCTSELSRDSGCRADDPQLAAWALDAWQQASDNHLSLLPALGENKARLRIYWVTGRSQLYGEARPIQVEGRRGAEVYILPSVAGADSDKLLRDAVVYLTCLHESGHGLGLPHTRAFADIMYSFQFGGDIGEYFGRYRRKLNQRDDIHNNSGISAADRNALLVLYEK